ncbi:bile acid:sodium symporter family protein [Desulforhopalus sp. 52FAK]
MGRKDYILIAVLYGSLISGVFFPHISEQVSPYIKYLMMTMLFLSFIKISPKDVGDAIVSNWQGLILGFILRLCIVPILAYYVTLMIYPPLALPILLLAGVSTGVSSPFFMSLCKGNISYCLVMAVTTSLFVPISLPFMVNTLAKSSLNYDLLSMAIFLATVIFVPLIAAFSCRKISPKLLEQINRKGYPIALVVIAAINFGALGRYVPYLQANPAQILYCALFSLGLGVTLSFIGWMSEKGKHWPDRVAAAGSQTWVNNVLIIALAIQIDQPLAATLSVFYFIPLYGSVVFFTVLANRK